MRTLQYKVISSESQYDSYCKELEGLLEKKNISSNEEDIIDLLTMLISEWEEEKYSTKDVHPIDLLKYLMAERNLSNADLMKIMDVNSKGLISDILNKKKKLSIKNIMRLARYFNLKIEAFFPYKLSSQSLFKGPSRGDIHSPALKRTR